MLLASKWKGVWGWPALGLLACLGFAATLIAMWAVPVLVGGAVLVLAAVAVAKPYWIVLFLIAYVPLETFLLKVPPVPEEVYFGLQFVGEGLVYVAFAGLAVRRLREAWTARRSVAPAGAGSALAALFRRTPLDLPLLAFGAVAVLSVAVNGAPLFGSLVNIKALLRYVVLFYLVVNLHLGPRQVSRLIGVLLAAGALQLAIGAVQLITGGAVNDLLMPREVTVSVAGETREFVILRGAREIGSVFGTLGDTVLYGTFLVVVLVVLLGRAPRLGLRVALGALAVVVGIAFSYSRASVLAAVMVTTAAAVTAYGVRKVVLSAAGLMGIGVLAYVLMFGLPQGYTSPSKTAQDPVQNVTNVLSRRYMNIALRTQRLGHAVNTPITVLVHRPLLGYGPDLDTTVARLNASGGPVVVDSWKWRKGIYEDVYWVAILGYYGVAGLVAFLLVFVRLAVSSWRIFRTAADQLTRRLALMVLYLVPVTAFLLMFNQVLEFRAYSFYFWLLPALMFALYAREQDPAQPRTT